MAKQLLLPIAPLPLSQQHMNTLIWIMFLLQVSPLINGVPFRTMAKSRLYWLTLIIDAQRLLPWFMIVCYSYISCQIHLVSLHSRSRPQQTVNTQLPACYTPYGNGLCFLWSMSPQNSQKHVQAGFTAAREGELQRGLAAAHETRTRQTAFKCLCLSRLWGFGIDVCSV